MAGQKEVKQTFEEAYYECERCEISNFPEPGTNCRMCPCPRGSCEAKKLGTIVTTIEIVKDDTTGPVK